MNLKNKDNVKRDIFGKCIICGDTQITSEGDCFYCNWKGTTGPGALFKQIVKQNNEKEKENNEN